MSIDQTAKRSIAGNAPTECIAVTRRSGRLARRSDNFGSQQIIEQCSMAPRGTEALLRSIQCPEQVLTEMRCARETRTMAIALHRSPLPSFSKKCLEKRWQIGPDSIRKILRHFGVDPGSGKNLLIPLADVLRCEGIAHPFSVWISARPEIRRVLTADLLTLEDWLTLKPKEFPREKTKYYRELSAGRLASIRIGKLHRFRPTLEATEGGTAANVETRT